MMTLREHAGRPGGLRAALLIWIFTKDCYICRKDEAMISDEFKHEVGSYMQRQADRLLAHQAGIARASYNSRTGSLARALASKATVQDATVSVPYPIHIRFLDLKKTRSGKKKRNYTPIYNRYVYGYLKSDIWRMLMAALPKQMIRTIEDNIKTLK